jgi:hypothetical protein
MRLLVATDKRTAETGNKAAADGVARTGTRGHKRHEHDVNRDSQKSLGLAM